jgi:hypothetical protein
MFRVRRLLALRWILPITQLVFSIAILWPVRHELTQQVQDAIRFGRLSKTRAPTVNEVLAVVIPERLTPEQKSEFKSFETRKWLPSVLNLPSGLIQLPYDILSPSKDEWVPVGLDLMTWRAISWPVLGFLFWWGAGRGIDALLAARQRLVRPKISWVDAAVGIALFLFCGIAAICFPIFGYSDRDPDFPLRLFSFGFGMWALLAGVVVTAKFCQRRIHKASVV